MHLWMSEFATDFSLFHGWLARGNVYRVVSVAVKPACCVDHSIGTLRAHEWGFS